VSRDDIVTHENFPEFVNLTVKKQLETNLLPLMAHVKATFDAVVPMELRSNLAPQQLRFCQRFRVFLACCIVDLLKALLPGTSSKGVEALTLGNG
jgi:hypothetical protein